MRRPLRRRQVLLLPTFSWDLQERRPRSNAESSTAGNNHAHTHVVDIAKLVVSLIPLERLEMKDGGITLRITSF